MDVKTIECDDGTRILSNCDDVNELLKNDWFLIEVGIIEFNSTPRTAAPIAIGFRLKKNHSEVVCKKWDEILTHNNSMYRFDSFTPIKENIGEVKCITDTMERELLKSTGWILLKESYNNVGGNSKQYAFGLLKD